MPNLKHSFHTLRFKGVRLRTGEKTDIIVTPSEGRPNRPSFEALTIERLGPGFEALTVEKLGPGFEALTVEKLGPGFDALTVEKLGPGFEALTVEKLGPGFEDLRVSLFTVPDPKLTGQPRPRNLHQPRTRS